MFTIIRLVGRAGTAVRKSEMKERKKERREGGKEGKKEERLRPKT